MSSGMKADLEAIEQAEADFKAKHGDEALARWLRLSRNGVDPRGELRDLQAQIADERGPDPELLDAIAWELQVRVDLLENARRSVRENGRRR